MPDRHSELPAHPDLEYYRKQAKHLQRSYETGDAAAQARAADVLGQGWKVRPFLRVNKGMTATLMDVDGPGEIRHIWMVEGLSRAHVLRFYWDNEETPSIEVNAPPASSASPPPSSNVASARTGAFAPSCVVPNDVHAVPFQRAMECAASEPTPMISPFLTWTEPLATSPSALSIVIT